MSGELKPCPFCGSVPEVWCDKYRVWALVEHGEGCLWPSELKHEIPERDFEAWNARARELTADQVRLAACHSVRPGLENKARVAAGYFDWRAIADELNGVMGA